MDEVGGINVNEIIEFGTDNTLPDLTGKEGNEVSASIWGIDAAVVKEISNMSRAYSSRHGMFASVPIICKGADCVYTDICMVSKRQRKIGRRCPMEIAAILARYDQWCEHFEISVVNDVIEAKDLVDATLIKDLVNMEIQMLRAENKIALNGDFMADTLLDIDKKCQPYYGKIVSPETEFLLSLQDKKIKILNQLNSTRKDKAGDKRSETASDAAIKLFQQVKEMEKSHKIINISDISFTDDGEIIEQAEVVEELIQEVVQGGDPDGGTDEKSS